MRRYIFGLIPMVSLLAIPLVACSATPEEAIGEDEAAQVWDSANNPTYVDQTFVVELDQLPLEGKTSQSLIPGDYWGTAKDSVNARWDGDESLSPAEKLEKALNKPGLAVRISETFGIRGQTNRKECKEYGDCSDLKDGSSCSIPRGETAGRCIPGWWGICHGWAPYAFSEPAPVKEVKVGEVTFYPGDLEGLMSLAYSKNLPTKFVGKRCNIDYNREGAPDRVGESECIDLNPGALFVLSSNLLGIRKQGFVEDRTFDDEVWNQPVESFTITNADNGKLKEVTTADANRLLEAGIVFSALLPKTTLAKDATKEGSFTATKEGEHVFKSNGNGDAELFVNIGAAASATTNVCASRGYGSNETCKVTLKAGDVLHYTLLGAAETQDISMEVGVPDDDASYKFNPQADKLFHVEMDLVYVTESRPKRTSHSTPEELRNYLRTEHYEFILETREGRVTGGEYIGASRKHHPDFFWWPSGKPRGSILDNVTYEDIRKIHDQAADTGTPPPNVEPGEERVLLENVSLRSSKYASVGLRSGEKMTVTMTGSGEADLYIGLGSRPTRNRFLQKSTNPGAQESITVTAPEGGGTYQVRAYKVTGDPNVTIKARISRAN